MDESQREYNRFVRECARKNRHNLTDAEIRVKSYLSKARIPYKKQRVIKSPNKLYIADFLLFSRIVLEIDGEYHNSNEQIEKDTNRTKDIERLGYTVIRMKNSDTETPEMIEKNLKERFRFIGINPDLFFPIPS